LEALDGQTAQVGGATVAIEANTALEPGLKVSQFVRAAAVVGTNGLTAVEIMTLDEAPAGDTFELVGIVESQGVEAWVIGGQTVLLHSTTEIHGAPVVGSRVKAQGSLGAGGEMVAREVELLVGAAATPGATAVPGAEFEFFGTVTSVAAEAWVVDGRTVRITAQTEIKAGAGLDAFVKVHALPQADGSLVAREIEPEGVPQATQAAPNGEELEFTGLLSVIDGDLWTIGATVVRVTAATEIKDLIEVGDLVKVHASAGADGVLVAREVELSGGEAEGGDDQGQDDGGNDDNSGPGGDDDDDGDDDHGSDDDDDDDDDHGGDDDDDDHGGDDDDDDDNSGPGGGDDD
jgi:hypothetical protein